MSRIIDIINSFDHNSKEYQIFLQDLILQRSDLPFSAEEIKTIENQSISWINARLNKVETRYNGLELLQHILPICDTESFSKHSIFWIAKTIQTLENSHSDTKEIILSCKILGGIVMRSKDIPELQKQVSMHYVKQLVNAIVNLKSNLVRTATFYLLAVLLRKYPEACEKLQGQIRKYILSEVTSKDENIVTASAKCFALFAKATEKSFKPPSSKSSYNSYTYSQVLICNSLNSIMDILFSDITELENYEVWDELELPDASTDNVIEYYYELEQRFSNLCIYLSTFLRGCGERYSVKPTDILRILCRGLAISPINSKHQESLKGQLLYLILPKLHVHLFDVLNSLISGFQHELLPFARTISQLFQQTLEWTEKAPESGVTTSGEKAFSNIRISVYRSLSLWLRTLGSSSAIEMVADEFLPHFLKDIIPPRNDVLLIPQNISKKGSKRNNRGDKVPNSENTQITNNSKLNSDLCESALVALQNVFISSSCWLKRTFYDNIRDVIVQLLYDIYLGSSEKTFYKEAPTCRLQLLKTLKSQQMYPHSLSSPPIQYSVQIYSMALNDPDSRVVEEAKLCSAEIEKIVHPSAPALQLPRTDVESDVSNGFEVENGEECNT